MAETGSDSSDRANMGPSQPVLESCPEAMPKRALARPAPPAHWGEAALHPIYLRLFVALLGSHGIDPAALLQRHRLPVAATREEDRLLPFAPLHDAIAEAIALTGRPWLGLEFGALAQPFSHGQVGFASVASGTLFEALQTLVRFAELRIRAVRFELHRDGGITELRVMEAFDLREARGFVLDACLVVVDRLLHSLSATPLASARYALPWPRPAWAGLYSQYVSAPVQFAAPTLTMRFPNAVLEVACLGADAEAFALAQRECQRKLEQGRPDRDLVSRVRRRLLTCSGALPNAERMARDLNLSTRGLFRHLRAAGVSYQGLVDELRCEQARWSLRHSDDPIAMIAERLGFADTSNFSRTFKRWTGTTPRAWRRLP